jgi:hypothetical protein
MKVDLIVLVLFITAIYCLIEPSYSFKLKKVRHSLSEKVARKLIDYFNLDKMSLVNTEDIEKTRSSNNDGSDNCKSLSSESILEYFFDVYSSNSTTKLISESDLENIIMKQVSDNPLDEEIKQKRKVKLCQRRAVIIFLVVKNVKGNHGLIVLLFKVYSIKRNAQVEPSCR